MRTAKNKWSLLLLVLAGIVLGGFIGQLLGGMSAFHWLNFGQTFGLTNPVILDLGILTITFAGTVARDPLAWLMTCFLATSENMQLILFCLFWVGGAFLCCLVPYLITRLQLKNHLNLA